MGCSENSGPSNSAESEGLAQVDLPLSIDSKKHSPEEILGSHIFVDTRLSSPEGQACISCHDPSRAFSDSRDIFPVSQGAFSEHFGGRNAPSAMYGRFVPPLHREVDEEGQVLFVGGLFLDGRVSGLIEQAQGPFLNPIEMGSTKRQVVEKVCGSEVYGDLFRQVYGEAACLLPFESGAQVDKSFKLVAKAIARFESMARFSPFQSKFDRVMAGLERFTDMERSGFLVFSSEERGNCAACHTLDTNNRARRALFTDFTYDNLGLPKNREILALGNDSSDRGLEGTTGRPQDRGLFRVPSLRNIALTGPYGHNGYFKTLEQIVDFYNTRDVKRVCKENLSADQATEQNCWPKAEFAKTMNRDELGDLKMSRQDIKALLLFLNTLTDKNLH